MQKRANSGRKKGTPNANRSELAAIIEAAISTKERMKLLAELARGVTVEETDKKGDVNIYTKPPDSFAIRQLNEYQYGKPAQSITVGTEDGEPFPIAYIPGE